MAGNVPTGNPWILDTPATIKATGNILRIKRFKFVGTTTDDECLVKNGAGVEIWRGVIGNTGTYGYSDSDYFGEHGFEINGLILTTLTHGVLLVYLAGIR